MYGNTALHPVLPASDLDPRSGGIRRNWGLNRSEKTSTAERSTKSGDRCSSSTNLSSPVRTTQRRPGSESTISMRQSPSCGPRVSCSRTSTSESSARPLMECSRCLAAPTRQPGSRTVRATSSRCQRWADLPPISAKGVGVLLRDTRQS